MTSSRRHMSYVLRPMDGSYHLVGECYVYGIMDGEIVQIWKEGRLDDEVFELQQLWVVDHWSETSALDSLDTKAGLEIQAPSYDFVKRIADMDSVIEYLKYPNSA